MDRALRLQLLRAACTDRAFMKANWHLITPDLFPEREEARIAEAATGFYSRYEEPVGALLPSEVEEISLTNGRRSVGEEGRRKLRDLFDIIQNGDMPLVSAKALADKLWLLKKSTFYERALEDAIGSHEKGELDAQFFSDLVERANRDLRTTHVIAHDYFSEEELKSRSQRRRKEAVQSVPWMGIDGLDRKIRGLDRGEIGMIMAPPAGGKGLALNHLDIAYALQGYNVWHISLEDPKRLVENRMDAAITGLPLKRLAEPEIRRLLKKRFRRQRDMFRAKIRVTDGTDGGYTITRVEREYAELVTEGFTPDVVTLDYDDEIECEKQYRGESARRFEFAEIYRRMRKAAKTLNVIWWTAAQPGKKAEDKKIITGKDVAEDYSKIRKVFICLTVGAVPKEPRIKFLYVAKHREDKAHFGVEIATDFDRAIFYDPEETLKWQAAQKLKAPESA